jgi:hypothetical protein
MVYGLRDLPGGPSRAAGLSKVRKGPNTVTKAACARAWRSFWGRMTLRAPAANGDRQLIIFTDTL